MQKPNTFIFYGPSGSGKGTQAELLSSYLEENTPQATVLHVYPGKLLRGFTKDFDTYTSKLTKQVMEKGGLLPAFIPIWAWTNFLIHNFSGSEHLIFDGVARKKKEVNVLEGALNFFEIEKPFVIYLDVSNDWARDKLLKRGRSDDNEDDIKNRLKWFDEQVLSLLDYYKENEYYNFLDINGEQTIEQVHQDIKEQIEAKGN